MQNSMTIGTQNRQISCIVVSSIHVFMVYYKSLLKQIIATSLAFVMPCYNLTAVIPSSSIITGFN